MTNPVLIFTIPSTSPAAGVAWKDRFAKFDYLGMVLSMGGLTCLIMGLNFGGTLYAWNSGKNIAFFVVSGVILIVFTAQQMLLFATSERRRMFPLHFFKIKEAVLLFCLCALSNGTVYVAIFYIPIYFEFARGDSAMDAAVRLLPLIFMIVFFVILSGGIMTKWGYYWPWYLGGFPLALGGAIWFCELPLHPSITTGYGA